ncbi:MAG: Ig-like domain-containing protein, partial [Pyrinomonadaceae bacterium]
MPSRVALASAASGERGAAPAGALRAAPAALPAPPLVPAITATKVDSFSDPDGDGKAEPGQTITYTVTVTNNGTDATNVTFNDTIDPNTTLVPGSVSTQPIASNDSYNVLGNVRIQPNAAAGLLANDCDPDNGGTCSSAGLTATGPATSVQGGNVSVNADGSFSYNPPAGYEGADSFTYTVSDGTHTDTATASFTVNEVVWFVDNAAAPGGDGRLTSPYNSLASVSSGGDLDEPSDFIFIHEGVGTYDGGIVLEDGQRLIGQGTGLDAALTTFGVSAPAHSDARPAATSRPVLGNSAGNVITLANGNSVLHLNAAASAASSSAIFGSASAGTTSVSNVGASATGGASGVSLLNHAGTFSMANSFVAGNSTGVAVAVSGGATGITFSSTSVSQSGGGRVVDVQSRTGGTVLFDAASSVTGTNGTTDAVSLLSNSGTVTFAGPVQLNTNAAGARGLVADSGTVNLTNSGNAVSSTGGAAVDLENLAVNINFATTFSTNSTGRGLRVDNVSGTASFGNTAVNDSGNTGVLLTDNAAAVAFSDLDIAPNPGVRALHAVNNAGTITSTSGVVVTTGAAAAVEIAGTSAAARSPL